MRSLAFATLFAGAEAATLAVTWEDCGAQHSTVTDLQPTSIQTGGTTTVTGTGTVDEDVTSAQFTAVVKARGVKIASCSGDATTDITCKLPLGAGTITVKAMSFPIAKGEVSIPVDVKTSAIVPASLEKVDVHIVAEDQNGDPTICLDVHTKKQKGFKEIAEHVNALGTSWTAAEPAKFESVEDVKPFLGTILKGEEGYVAMAKDISDVPNGWEAPASFDVRTAFPECASISGNIRDQSSCGSCWAFGATEAFNDRHCIATGNKVKLSVEDTTANCGLLQCFSMGCGGGQPGLAWNWFESTGVVTGGDYFDIGSGDSCAPYTLAPCAHHVPATAKYPACPSSEYPTPSLSKCSESGYSKSYSGDKIKATDSYSLSGISSIQADIVKYGSATAAFTVYDDFPTYKSGVYHKTSNKQLGGHAVKFLGWGTENGQDYWLVANSWNEQWGDGGTFKIRRGNNECGIEGQVSAGRAGSSDIVA
jgi:cathepsin B